MDQWFSTPLIVTMVIATIGALVGVGIWVGRISKHVDTLDDQAKEDRSVFNTAVTELRNELRQFIFQFVSTDKMFERNSPYKLTEYGEEVAVKLDVHMWVKNNTNRVLPDVRDMRPFEIDRYCHEQLASLLDKEDRDRIAEFVYNEGVHTANVEAVFAIVLRDALIENIAKQARSSAQ